MKNQTPFDGFTINIFLDTDDVWIAHFTEYPEISSFSDSPEKALKELKTAWIENKKAYSDLGIDNPILKSKKMKVSNKNVVSLDQHRVSKKSQKPKTKRKVINTFTGEELQVSRRKVARKTRTGKKTGSNKKKKR